MASKSGTEVVEEGSVAMETPSLLRADRDLDLLARPELRSVRLGLEYLKPELAFNEMDVRHTVVVFGGGRLEEPWKAQRSLDQARRAAEANGANPKFEAAVRAAERALEHSRFYTIGREFGRLVAGHQPDRRDGRIAIMTGGGPGGMEAANRGALEAGGLSIGLNIMLPEEQRPNGYLTPELSFEFRYFAIRKLHFMLRARALVALPGGYGTLDELFGTLCLVQTGRREQLPVILVGEAFWRRVVDLDFLAEQGMVGPGDPDLVSFAETADEIWQAIHGWYEDRGQTLSGAAR